MTEAQDGAEKCQLLLAHLPPVLASGGHLQLAT